MSRTRIGLLAEIATEDIEAMFSELRAQGLAALQEEGFTAADCDHLASLDLRYAGQSYTLNLPWSGIPGTIGDFHARHLERYGHRLDLPVELVNLRLRVRGPCSGLRLAGLSGEVAGAPFDYCRVAGVKVPVPQFWRHALTAGQRIEGPALVAEKVATTWVTDGWLLDVDEIGNLQLRRRAAVPSR